MKESSFVYFGTPYVAKDTLATLVASGFIPSLVVSSPDAPQGRGMVLTPSPTKEWAEAHGIKVITPEKLTAEVIEEIRSYSPSFGIAVAYGKILPKKLLEVFPLGVLNVHYSLLPKYRGASPVEAALLNNDSVTGVAIQKMVPELDAGDVYVSQEVTIDSSETTRELRPRLLSIGAELLVSMLPSFISGSLVPSPQEHTEATHAGKITKAEGELSLSDDPQKNWSKYRAYAESPGTYFFIEKDGKRMRVKIKTATLKNGVFMPERVVPEGKKEMSYADLVR